MLSKNRTELSGSSSSRKVYGTIPSRYWVNIGNEGVKTPFTNPIEISLCFDSNKLTAVEMYALFLNSCTRTSNGASVYVEMTGLTVFGSNGLSSRGLLGAAIKSATGFPAPPCEKELSLVVT